MSIARFHFRTLENPRFLVLEVERPGGSPWTCPIFDSFGANDTKMLRKTLHDRLLVWYGCDCAERQFAPTRDRLEQEWQITYTVRRWVAGMADAKDCDFPIDETVETTMASWCVGQAVVIEDGRAVFATAAADEVRRQRTDGGLLREEGWQRVRLSVLASLPRGIWDDWVTFQAAHEMAEEEQRPWSETFLELVGVPREAWDAEAPPE